MNGFDVTGGGLRDLFLLEGEGPAGERAGSLAPLSHGQRALWFVHHLVPGGSAYNIAAAARVLTPIHAGVLERAFQALVDRHDALRTTFPVIAGEPRQAVAGRLDFALACEDATGWSEERMRSRLAEEAWRPFDLEQGPLLRVTLWTGGAGGPLILLVIHHTVADFWSLAILARELSALCREAAGAGPALLPPPGHAYAEHVRLEREMLAGERGEALLAYWQERLAGLPTLELATDRPRPAVQTYRGDSFRLRLPAGLATALRARGRARRGTLFMTLIAAFQALLCRHTGQEDLAVGSPRAGRSQSKLAGTVGYFVNPVVLRGDLAGDPGFTELLERTRAMVLSAFEHGDYPLPLLAEHLQPERDASRAPLFQVSFVLQKETRGAEGLTAFALGEEGVEVDLGYLRLESLSLHRPPAPFDLLLHAVERQGGLSLALQYNSDLFDATTAARLMERFAVLLESIVRSPDLALSALPVLSEAERHQVLCAWNDTAGPEREENLFELFEAQARRTPEAEAVVFEEERVTYAELADRARALACHLAELGVGPEVLVGVAVERSVEMVVGLLGVLGAGGAYLPLEPGLPRQRLAMILEDASPAVLLTLRSQAAALPLDAAPGARFAWLDGVPPAAAPGRRLARAESDNAAYVIFTSGSTGRPKGVVNSHRGIVNRLLWMQEAFALDAGDRVLHKTPFGFDISVWEIFMPLLLGARLVVARPEGHRDNAYLVRLVQREGVTVLHFVPSMLPFFLAEEGAAGCRSLRHVAVSGEALPWEVEQRCLQVLAAPLHNLYGPTEAAVEVTAWTCQAAARPRSVPIGRPIRNTRIHIIGRRFEAVPPGAVGELAIGGVQVARGYLGRPDLTAERFIPDPHGGTPGTRLYRTGDLSRYLPGGEIEFLGRLDDQVKIRGFRIELREIESALATHPDVREAAVVLRQEPGAERSLLACVVLRDQEPGAGTVAALRDHLAALLPSYMVPAFAFRGELDRLPNGKLDRRALARWAPLAGAARAALAPRTPLEELLACLFCEVLGVGRIGVEDSFFEHGGHSIAAMRLTARVREALGADLPLHQIFETPTVAALARLVEGAARSGVPPAPPLVPVPRGVPLPLSFAQQRLWFLHQLEPASPVYNMPAAIHLRGWLDRSALAAALDGVTLRHETLRTRFIAEPGGPAQVIDAPGPVPLPVIDLAGLPAAQRTEEARRLARGEALRPFDLVGGPLLRATLVSLGAEERLLLLTLHHIIGDGWSLRVLARELGEIYGAWLQRRPPALPVLEIQYGDYAVWQRRWLQGDLLAAELAHWRARLAGAPSVLELPLDRPRPAMLSHRGAALPLVLPADLLDSLQALARRQGVTLFMGLLAAFQALLSRISGAEDVSVGTPVAGRGQMRTEGLIGFFVNTLVMRTDLSGEPSFARLLERVREVALDAYAHQDLPFEKLVEELQPRRDLSHSPLFQASFTLDGEPPPSLRLGDAEASLWPVEQETEKFDLSLSLGVAGEGLSGELGFRTDLFDGATAERWTRHFGRLLAGAVADPRLRLPELPLLSAAERRQLLGWNAAEPAQGRETTVTALWAAQVSRAPEAPAVSFAGETLSYGELDRRAGRLARRLRRLGVGPEERVGMLLERSLELVVGLVGILKAGGAYVPLDPSAPQERLAFLCRDSGIRVLVTDGREDLPSVATVVRLGAKEDPEMEAGWEPEPATGPDSLCYVIYTSGSTGQPKGVLVRHGSVARLLSSTERWFGFGPADVWTLFHSSAFDFSVWELWGALAYGGRLVVVPYWVSRSPEAFWRLLAGEGVTVLNQTPSAFRQLIQADGEAPAAERERLALRLVIFGGEALDLASLRPWYERHDPGAPRLVNMYGITETTVHVSYRPLEVADLEESHRSPIGQAIPDLGLRLLGPGLELVPVGVPGEICVGGPGLARGYLGRPELTAERFVPDPFSERPGERLYRSGDLARYRPDGQVDYLGRRDQQVKVRGFRIEPGEIEAALLAHPEVRSALVLPRQDPSGGAVLVACLETEPGAVSAGELRHLLRARLPEYMVPAAFVFLESMPLTGNGKLDRRALASLPLDLEGSAGAQAPRTPAEELVAGIFAEVLKLERVGAAADFFELGGHSLLATQVASRVRAVFGVELPVRTVFEAATVTALARWIERAGAGEGPPPIRRVSRQGRLELSFAQQRLWFLDQLQPGSTTYNIPMAVRIRGPLDVAALAASLAAGVRRHESLRTTFTAGEGGPVQRIAGDMEIPLPVIGLAAGQVRPWVEAEARRPFDLEKGPLVRASLLRTAEKEHLLLLCLHHIIADGWSIGVLVNEIAVSYGAHLEGRPAALPPIPVQYADFAAWQREWMSGEVLEERLSCWRRRLAGAPSVLELPTDRPRPALRSERGGYLPVQLPERLAVDLRALSRREGATLFMTLLAGFQALLSRYSGQEDVLVGSPVAGRDLAETEPLVGLFVNTLVLRLDLSGEPALDQLLGRVREMALDAYSRADLPFELLVAELQPERDLRHTPLFQVMFVMQTTSPVALRLRDLVLEEHPLHTGTAKFDLMLTFGHGLTGFLEYSSDLFDETTVERLAGHLENLLTGLAAGSGRSWTALPLLGPAERAQLLEEWNDTARPFPEATLHEAFARQAERHPDLPAVVSEGAVLTCRDLDRQASALAARLRALGVGPEVPVALYLERSAAAVVAILGVLKAGGAYLPLETQHPAERLAGILEDAGHPLLVTERRLEGALTAKASTVVWMDEVPAAGDGVPVTETLPEGLAYVLHTSGSTGKPKGVCCTHRGVLNLLDDFTRRQPLAAGSRGSLWTSLSFDVSVYEVFSPLLAGGAVHIAPEAVRQDAGRFIDWLIEERIDSAYVPPFMVAALRERLERTPGAASLRRLLVGVEPIPEPLLARIAELCPGLAVINGYGPTEATVCATLYDVEPGRDRFGDSPVTNPPVTNPPVTPIGRAAQNTGLYLLDRYREPVPVGVPGELYIAGAGLARGYLNKPEATAERFVPHPWSMAGGERLYRTGDLARRRPDGNLEFLGRIDHQIKLRGFRIEPGEIEAALRSHPAVREAVVTVLAPAGQAALEGREHRRLVAYWVGVEGLAPSSRELREFLRERLPAYMVPAAFVALPALPLTASGKLDRKALPAPAPEGAADEPLVRTPPRTPVEELVAGVFAQVLGIERVGLEDDFFALGGHSLLATQVASRVRSVLGVELPVRAVFEAPTVEGLAARTAAAPAEDLPPLVPADRTGPLPLSFSQERLWFLQQLEPGSAAYNIRVTVELSGSLREDLLSEALAEVVRRHESLRTTFPVIEGAPRQRISPPPSGVSLPLVDLSALPAAAGPSAAESLEREQGGRVFDLERGPLFTALLVRLTGECHRFLLNLHHTIADGWSIGVLVREMGALYAAYLEGRLSPLPELPVQYADFAVWQRETLAGQQAAQLAYWEGRLGGEVPPVLLATDRPRPAVQTFHGGRRRLLLAPDLTARLARFGRAQGVTLFMTLLAATQALLSRQCGEQDVPVGAPVAGRQRVETEGLIGCFLNTLVLRTDLSGLPSFRDLAARVRTVTLEAYANQDVPFEAVLARLRLGRDLSRPPLFQVLFNMLNLPRPELSLPELSLRLLTPAEIPSKLDLTFYVAEAGAGVQIDLIYNTGLFEEARIADLLAQLELLLAQAVERPEEPVEHFPLLTAAAVALLPDPGETLQEPDFPPLSRLFLDRERELPEQAALCWSAGSWTYSELGGRAREIARAVRAAGGGPGEIVAVSGPRGPELIAGLLGAFLSGGVLLILDRNLPEARLRVLVEEARPACLVYIGDARPEDGWLWEPGLLTIVTVQAGLAALSEPRADEPAADLPLPAPDDPAYVFFTSGTTGRPKAVLGRQKGLSHFLTWQRETFGIGPGDRAAQLTGLSFDVVLRDIFLPLTSGATLDLPEEDDLSPERALPWLRERAITVVHTVPSLASAWLGSAPQTGSDALRWTFFAGEPLLDQVVERWRAAFPRTGVVNLYGPTETTLAKCFYRVPEPPVAQVQPVGAPLPQTQALVLAQGRRCGIGEVGEIVLRTPFRSLGYLNPEEGRQRFRPNPFRNDPGDTLYFTGDRGRYRLDGTLDILGRMDEQVKVRGVRIEPAEVRAALGRHPAVWESAVLAPEIRPGDRRLVAYLVLRPGAVLDLEHLRRHLRRELPETLVPSTFVPLDALPLTPNGKVDRRALERIALDLPSSDGERHRPYTPVEEIVAGLWSEVLGLPWVGPDDNFFQLGGHSLSGTQVVSRLRQALQVDLPLRTLFEAPTVSGLAAEIERRRRHAGSPQRPAIASFREDRGSPPPLSFAQERFWAGRELEARDAAPNNLPTLVRFEGHLDLACLRRALQEVVDRHELLRTSIGEDAAGRPFQVIHPAISVQIPLVDLEPVAPPGQMEEVRRWTALAGRSPFDYGRAPMFRLVLFRCAERDHVLFFVIHHILFDGWSRSVLAAELSALYNAFREGRPSPLPPLAFQYQDFARWQRQTLAGEALASEVAFWREHLAGARPLDLGGARPRPARPTFQAGNEMISVPEELERKLEVFAVEHCATLFMTLLAAFNTLLHYETGRDDMVVICLFANRNQAEIENLIGDFYAGLPLRTRLSGARTFREVLERVRDVTLTAHEHPDILYEPVFEGMGFQDEEDRNGLETFRVLFQLAKLPPADQAWSGLQVTRLPFNITHMRKDLSLFLFQADRIQGRFRYNRDVLEQERVVRMRDRFLQILEAAVADPDCPLAELLAGESVGEAR